VRSIQASAETGLDSSPPTGAPPFAPFAGALPLVAAKSSDAAGISLSI